MARKKRGGSTTAEIVELTRRVAEQKRRSIERTEAIEKARREIRERGQFIPMRPGINESTTFCF